MSADFSLIDLFRAEVETHNASLSNGLLALESKPGDPTILEPLMRAAHSIKGAARIIGLDTVVTLAHAMEDCFVAAQEKKLTLGTVHIDTLLQGVDFFAKLKVLPESEITPWLTAQESAMHSLQATLNGFTGAETSAPAPITPVEPVAPAPEPKPSASAPATPTPSPATSTSQTAESDSKTVETTLTVSPQPETPEDKNRAVRVVTETLDQLLGIAAETLVETSRLEPARAAVESIKKNHARLSALTTELRSALESGTPFSELQNLRIDIYRCLSDSGHTIAQHSAALEDYALRANTLTERLYHQVIVARMSPFRDATTAFPRMVRDLARQLGKQVRLEIIGGNVMLDRDSLEKLEAPLGHILRNALDHGIETPLQREQAGKPTEGLIRIEARHHAGMLFLSINDDGRGIELNRIRAKAIAKGLVPYHMATGLSDAELFEFMFLPGFSTADRVTEVSGRGVGLDVVQSTVHQLGGTIRIRSQVGASTTFILQLPVTRSVLRTLIVSIGGEPYALPLARIERTHKTTLPELEMAEERVSFRIDDQLIPLVSAAEVLGIPPEDQPRREISIVVISTEQKRYGIEVDSFVGERRIVVRPLDPRLGKVPDINAASLTDDGRALLILDIDDLLRSIESLMSGDILSRSRRDTGTVERKKNKRVLVVDDSLTVRELERKLLEKAGYEVDSAVDGMEGWNAVRLAEYDLVISDVDMPRMNGIELVQHIRGDSRLRTIPIVIVSYKDRAADRMRGLEAGANYYLTKGSFHDTSFLRAVVDLIGEANTV